MQGEHKMRILRLVSLGACLSIWGGPAIAQEYLSLPLVMGVYECYDQSANPTPDMMFGLLDDTNYNNYDGVTGTYAYDPTSGTIEVGLQTGAPARFVRIAETGFRALNDDGSLAGFVCPLNRAKDANSPPW